MNATQQTIVLAEPGRFEQRADGPVECAPGEALVRVRRIGVCGTDLHAFAGRQPFFEYPRVLGHELAVEVIEVEPNDRGIAVGDRCTVEPYLNCGRCIACRRGKTNCCEQLAVLGVHVDGGMRPTIAVPVDKLHRANGVPLDQLAMVEMLSIGAHAVERATPEADETALVIGAGPIGLGLVQSLTAAGTQPIVMDTAGDRLAFCREVLGIERTLSPGEATGSALRDLAGGDLPTVIYDATGHPGSMAGTFDLIAPGGRIVFVGLFVGELAFDDPNFHRREVTLMSSRNATAGTFAGLLARIGSGQIDTTGWVTHRLTLDELPERFADLPGSPGLVKAMIDLPG